MTRKQYAVHTVRDEPARHLDQLDHSCRRSQSRQRYLATGPAGDG